MDYLFELFKILLPAGMVVVAVQVMMSHYFTNQKRMDEMNLRKSSKELYLPVQMQAYERLILLLERISIDKLILRVQKPGMSVQAFQLEMLKSIRQEMEHNLSQQLYISENSWKLIKVARDETTKLINLAATSLPADAQAIDLGKALLELAGKIGKLPTDVAIEGLKNEFRTKF